MNHTLRNMVLDYLIHNDILPTKILERNRTNPWLDVARSGSQQIRVEASTMYLLSQRSQGWENWCLPLASCVALSKPFVFFDPSFLSHIMRRMNSMTLSFVSFVFTFYDSPKQRALWQHEPTKELDKGKVWNYILKIFIMPILFRLYLLSIAFVPFRVGIQQKVPCYFSPL